MASLSLQGIQKIYPNGFHAVKDFNLEIADKEFIIFVGMRHLGDVQKDHHRVGPYPLVAVDERMVTDETEAQTGSLFQQRGI